MLLSHAKLQTLKPRSKIYRKADSHGLAIEVRPNGTKVWRYRFRVLGKPSMLSLGEYPSISLSEARRLRDEAKQQLARGLDPAMQRRLARAAHVESAGNTFAVVALEWFSKNESKWTLGSIKRTRRLFEKDLFPWLGALPIAEMKPAQLLHALRRIEGRGALETAARARALVGQVFRYAIGTGRAERDISQDLRGALQPHVTEHFASITDPRDVGGLLRAIHSYSGHFGTRCALMLAPLVFVRPGNLRKAEWQEFDLDEAQWRIPAEKMKSRRPHLTPLSTQAVAILRDLQSLTGRSRYVFPSVRTGDRPMSENTVNAALRRLGYTKNDMTGHGFRHMASTLLHEQGFRHEAIERQLAHAERDVVSATYNWAQYMPERKRMMKAWANYLDGLRGQS